MKGLRAVLVSSVIFGGIVVSAQEVAGQDEVPGDQQGFDCYHCRKDPADPNNTLCISGQSVGTTAGCASCIHVCAYV